MNAVKTQVSMSNFMASLKIVPKIKAAIRIDNSKTGLMGRVIDQIAKGATTAIELSRELDVSIMKIHSTIDAAKKKKVTLIVITKETHDDDSLNIIRLVGDNSDYVRTNDGPRQVRRKDLLELCATEYVCIKSAAKNLGVCISTIYKDVNNLQADNKITVLCTSAGTKKVKAVCDE